MEIHRGLHGQFYCDFTPDLFVDCTDNFMVGLQKRFMIYGGLHSDFDEKFPQV